MAGSFPPLPTAVRALQFYSVKILAFFSLVDSHIIMQLKSFMLMVLVYWFWEFGIPQGPNTPCPKTTK